MIFQEPANSLNPVFTIGDQIIESIKLRLRREKDTSTFSSSMINEQVYESLKLVKIAGS